MLDTPTSHIQERIDQIGCLGLLYSLKEHLMWLMTCLDTELKEGASFKRDHWLAAWQVIGTALFSVYCHGLGFKCVIS